MNQKPQTPWILTKAGVMVMLFVALGPFGLVFLYKSPEFTNGQKVFWTLMVLLYTAAAVALIAIIAICLWRLFLPILNP